MKNLYATVVPCKTQTLLSNRILVKIFASVFVCVALNPIQTDAQIIRDTINNTATTQWAVPAGVTTVQVEAWGGGGAGGRTAGGGVNIGAGGGGGGAYVRSLLTVTPSTNVSLNIGAQGTSNPTAPGGNTWFVSNTTLLALGGASVDLNTFAGGQGGQEGPSIGTVKRSGGNGATGTATNGGGGGSSAGNAAAGVSATTSAGAIAPIGGGNGGNGAQTTQGPGNPGVTPGGGGGGSLKVTAANVLRLGGNGGTGQIVISYGCANPLSATVNFTNITCNGSTDGTITVSSPAGGAGTYEYRLNTGTWGASGSFTGLGVGSYAVQIRDAANPFCEATLTTVNITNPAVLSATVSKMDVNCFGANNGSITVSNPTGGNGTYQVSINGTNWFAVSSGSPYTFSSLAPNTYTVQIRDAAFPSCVVNLGNQTITQPAQLNAVVAKTNITCFGFNNGTITVSNPIGGGGTYEISIDNVNWQAITSGGTFTYNMLTPASYTVRIRDAAVPSCQVTLGTQMITQPTALIVSGSDIQPSCFAGGSIDVTVSGGTTPYTYDWADISGSNNPSDRFGLVPGSYSVTITDANGCFDDLGPYNLIEAVGCDGVYVCREGSSTISVSAIPGATGYRWELPLGAVVTSGHTLIDDDPLVIVETTGPSIDVDWSAVTVGAYEVCVEPTNDCGPGTQQCREIIVNEVLLNIVPNNVPCNGENNGSIFLQVTQGVGPFTYSWAGPGGYTANVQNPQGLQPGTYNVTVVDSKGCVNTATALITEPAAALSVSGEVVIDEDPFGSSNGSITLTTVSGGTIPYSYQWSKAGDPFFAATTQNINSLAGGTYTVTVTDANGCTLVRSYTVDQIGGPFVLSSITKTDILCFGDNNGSINLNVIGGSGTYTYTWTALSGGPVPPLQVNNQNLTTLPPGTYQVTVSDGVNADIITSITVTQPAAALSAVAVSTNPLCFGGSGSINLTPSGGTAPYTYLWSNGSAAEDLVSLGNGTYTVTVTDANGCTTTTAATVTQPTDIVISGLVTNASCNTPNSGEIDITPGGGIPGYTYLWSNGATSQDISMLAPGTYTVSVTDANMCVRTATFTVGNVCIETTKTLLAGPINNVNGTYTLTYQVRLRNTGNIALTNVQAVDDLSATYATFTLGSVTSAAFTVNGSYTGSGMNTSLLAPAQTLAPGQEGFINITLTVTPGDFANNPFTNIVSGTAEDADGVETDDDDTEDVTFTENPIIGVAKALTAGPTIQPNGSYNLTFTFTVRNYGDVSLENIQVTDDLDATFGVGTYTVTSLTASSGFTINGLFDGSSDQNMLSGSTPLAVNAIRTITLSLNVTPTSAGPFSNLVTATGEGPGGTPTTDDSHDGLNPDPDNDGPGDNDDPTPIVFPENPQIGLAKRVLGTPVNNNDGTYTLTYELRVRNTGDVILYDVQVTDDLDATFGAGLVSASVSSADFSINGLYDGDNDINLLTASGNTVAVGQTKIILLTVTVEPGSNLGPYQNSAEASGISAFGTAVDDTSHNGIDVDPENDGPGNNSTPTPVSFTESPLIGLAKTVSSVVNNEDGTYDVTYTILVQNYGNAPLVDVQVSDNLANTFTGAIGYTVQSISTSGSLTANTVANFNMTNNLLVAAGSSVAFNTSHTITLVVRVTPGPKLGVYNNTATGTAEGPGGTLVSDVSQNGNNPAPGGGNNPGSFSQPTPLNFAENPSITVEKTIVAGPVDNMDNTYTLTYEIRVENTGDVPLNELQLVDNLAATFGMAASYTVDLTSIFTQPVSTTLVLNMGFNGNSDPELLDGNVSLLVDEFAVIRVEVTVEAIEMTNPGGPYNNQAAALAFSPSGSFLIDLNNVDVTFYENPEIVITKTVESLVNNGNGTYTVTFRLQLESTGDVPVYELELYDDIVTQFSSLNPTGFLAEEGLSLAVNPTWDGTSTSNILAPGQFFDEEIEDDYFVFISFTIDDPAPNPVTINNVATVFGEGPLGSPATDSDDEDVEIMGLGADLQLDKSVSNATPNVGDVITFTITVSNAGPTNATGVSVEDLVPNGYGSIANISNSGVLSGSTITWSGLSVSNGGNIALTFDATVLAPGMGISYLNYAQIEASDQFDPNSTPGNDSNNEDDDDTQDITPQVADLNLDKTVSNATPNVGDVITFTITVSNAGPNDATGVAVEDLVPNGYGSITNISNSGVLSGSTITWSGLSITNGGNIVLTFDATVLAPGPGVNYLNYAQITDSDQFDPNSTPDNDSNNEDDDDTQDITPQVADLNLDKTVSNATPNVGDVITFTITVSNAGPNDATGVAVEDLVPNGYGSITNISNSGVLSGSTITWSGLSITNGGNIVLTFDATVLAPGMGVDYENYAQITDSDQFDPNSTPDNDSNNEDDDDTQDITPQVADLNLDKTVSNATPNVGDVITFTITVSNAGPNDATGVAVEDLVPNGYGSITNISNGGTLSGSTITWTGLSVSNGGNIALTFQATVLAPGMGVDYENYAQITDSDQFDPNSTPDNDSDNEDDDDTQDITPQQADLSLDKTVSNATPNVGDVVTFTITVSNAGPNDATGVAVEDLVPNGYGSISNISNGGTLSGSTITWTGLSLLNGDDIMLTFQATVLAPGMGVDYENYAQITDSDQFDPNSTPDNDSNNEDDDDTQDITPQVADLSLDKTVSNATPNVGDVITFTITVSNAGPNDATGVSVEDLVPNGYGSITNISNGGTLSGSTITWTGLSVLNAGDIALTFDATVLAPGPGVNYLNYAQITDSDQFDPNSTPDNDSNNEDDDDTQNITPQVLGTWDLTKTAAPQTYAAVGQVINYSFTLENTGNVPVLNISLVDNFVDPVPGVIRGLDLPGNNDNTLDVGEIWVFSAQYTITQVDLNNGSFENTATANGDYYDANAVLQDMMEEEAVETVDAIQNPEIEVRKSTTSLRYSMIGEVIDYTIEVENTGNVSISSVVVTDNNADPGSVMFDSGDTNMNMLLDPGEIWVYTAERTVVAADRTNGSISNIATAEGEDPNNDPIEEDSNEVTLPALFADNDAFVTAFNTPVGGEVSPNDTYPTGSQFNLVTNPTNGNVVLDETGTFVYVPNPGFTGVDQITYSVCLPAPNQMECVTAIATIVVGPDAVDDSYVTPFETPVMGDVSDNDDYPVGSVFAVATPLPMGVGTLTFNNDGTFEYEPAMDFTGVTSFTYTVCLPAPNGAVCDEATVTLVVGPEANDDSYTTPYETPVTANVNVNDVYPANSTFNQLTQPANGTVVFSPNGSFTYTPDPGFTGTDSYTYEVCLPAPNGAVCDPATVTIVVGPDAVDDSYVTPFETPVMGDVSDNDDYPVGSVFAVATPLPMGVGTLTFNNDGTFEYEPAMDFTGVTSFTYTVCLPAPNGAVCDEATVTLVVGPEANDDSYTTPYETPVTANVNVNDVYPANSTFNQLTQPANGTVVFSPNGSFTYTPDPGFTGTDSYTYEVCLPAPNGAVCDPATVTIVVGPDAVDDSYVTPFETPVMGDVSDNDDYPVGSVFAVATPLPMGVGTLTFNNDGTFEYEPAMDFTGVTSFHLYGMFTSAEWCGM
jgi:uncharacterized repeat protein (TIGR01451 family)